METARKFERLIRRGILSASALDDSVRESSASEQYLEDFLIGKGIPKHEIIFCLSEYYNCPVIEYEEGLVLSRNITTTVDLERSKKNLWVPLSVTPEKAEVIACYPDDPAVMEDMKRTLGAAHIEVMVALPSDLVRIIENSQDLNPGFPPSAGRTPLAKVRTFLADRRSLFACHRTSFAKGRTGLAFLRTGISFMAIALVLFRLFGFGYLTILEAILLVSGFIIALDGIQWYVPARKTARNISQCSSTESTCGTTVLEVSEPGNNPVFRRTNPIRGAEDLRSGWLDLSPVMRRRYLASDRTDLAEERTVLACYRTSMAQARTGLAFTRTGVSFIGFGTALMRQFHAGSWTIFDIALILIGTAMALEGFHWYIPGRRAGIQGLKSIRRIEDKLCIWDFCLPSSVKRQEQGDSKNVFPPFRPSHAPGIWATTGLALERTVLAERRNVMARLRTVMARSRTGMAFIRTGMSIASVGMGLLVYFGPGNLLWSVFDLTLLLAGVFFITDGIRWHSPSETIRRQFPYCFGEMEITIPDYGRPARMWNRTVFSHDGD